MEISGHIHNGVVILDQSTSLPEGTPVTVTLRSKPLVQFAKNRKRVEFPLVQSISPGSVISACYVWQRFCSVQRPQSHDPRVTLAPSAISLEYSLITIVL